MALKDKAVFERLKLNDELTSIAASEEQIETIVSQQVLPKVFEPGDVSDLCQFLLGPSSASLSGQVLHVGGA